MLCKTPPNVPGPPNRERGQDPAGVLRDAGGLPIILRETSWCGVAARWPGEGKGTAEDLLEGLADGKPSLEADELEFIPHGKNMSMLGDFKMVHILQNVN